MKEIKAIVEAYNKIDFSKNKAALATVVRVEGSSYRRTGARMLITDSGEWVGGISGGCLEGDALKKARFAIAQNKPSLVTYDTTEDDPYQIGVGLGCNGIIDVLLTPLTPQNDNNNVLMLQECIGIRQPNILITVINLKGVFENLSLGQIFKFPLPKQFLLGDISEKIANDGHECLQTEKSVSRTYSCQAGEITLFLEVIKPAIHLLVFGGNYDIYAMVKMAKEVGWQVTVVCNPLKVHKSLFSLADAVVEKEKGETLEIDNYTVALLMAHDYESDFKNMRNLLKTDIKYIGMLGPKKRTDKMFLKLSEEGNSLSERDLDRIATPVGLDIGASNPEEIAISIIAEIKTFFSNRTGQRLRFRQGSIYEES